MMGKHQGGERSGWCGKINPKGFQTVKGEVASQKSEVIKQNKQKKTILYQWLFSKLGWETVT